MGFSIKSIGRAIAHPFEQVGQGVKHFFTGPEYDKMASNVNAASQATGQTTFGSSAPTGPVGAQGANRLPTVGSSGYSSAPSTGVGQPFGGVGKIGGAVDWAKNNLLPHKPDGSVDWVKAIELGLVVGSAVEGYRASNKADKMTQEAIDIAREREAQMQPLRDQAMASLMAGKKRPDLSNLTDQTNPYRQGMRTVGSHGGY